MISCGEKLDTSFKLKVFRDGATRDIVFQELLTRRTIVSVYMRNNTGSCDRQNAELLAHAAEFERAGFNLVALSRDSAGSHARYAAAKRIPYPLASDPEDRFAKAANAIVEKTMYGRKFFGPARAAFLLEPDGTVLAVMEKIDPVRHGQQLLALINSL